MKNVIKYIFLPGICLVLFLSPGRAQELRARVIGLETDSVYMALLGEEQVLNKSQDSLSTLMQQKRAALNEATASEARLALSDELLRMESEVFALRNRLGGIANRINTIEQAFIMKSMTRPGIATPAETTQRSATNYANLIDNDYFKKNLTDDEYNQLQQLDRTKAERESILTNFQTDYDKLKSLKTDYEEALTPYASDSIFQRFRMVAADISQWESDLEETWTEPYQQAIYLYSYLLDKLNKMNELASLNDQARALRPSHSGELQSTGFAEYPLQQQMLIEYQLALASALNLPAAVDSLNRAKRSVQGQELALPKIELKEKDFVHYEGVSVHDPSLYNAENPIPEVQIPNQGTYYSVTVGSFSSRQAVSVFRNVAPVYYERTGGTWRYYVGLFRSYGDAVDAVQRLRDIGFRRPEAVRWHDGKYTNLATEATRSSGYYRIEIDGLTGELPENVRFLLNRYARGKEITRAGNTYFVGTFNDKIHADEVMSVLQNLDGLDLKLETLEE